jgi:hypothetical protein
VYRGANRLSLIESDDRISRGAGLSSVDVEEETVILDEERGPYFGPKEVAAPFRDLIKPPQPLGDARDTRPAQFDSARPVLESDLRLLIRDPADCGLVNVQS